MVATLNAAAILVVAAVGLSVVFGMMGVVNLAHGEFMMTGAYVTFLATSNGLPLFVAVPLAGLAVAIVGLVVERLIIRPLYGRLFDTLLATWGVSLVIIQIAVILAGPFGAAVSTPLGVVRFLGISMSQYSLVLIGMAALILLALYFVLTRTPYGLKAQAVTQNPDMAAALGIDVKRINMWTFALGGSLAGIAGGLIAPLFAVTPVLGQAFMAQVFLSIIVAGPAVISGTIAAGTGLATVASVTSFFWTAVVGQAALLITAVVVLRFYPRGISASWRRPL